MKVIIEIPDKDIPKQQDTMSVNFIFTDGCPCQCDYPFDVIKESDDCVSRQAAIDACLNGWNKDYKEIVEEIRALPPVTPQYTEAEIQRMQDLEFAEIQKAYEIGKAEGSEVLDEIREEIMDINVARDEYSQRQNDYCDGVEFAKRYFLQIIDKYKAEGSEKE